MPSYIYAQDKRGSVYVNLYVASNASFKVGTGDVSLAVESEMPWGGRSTVKVSANQPTRAAIKLRVPGWARNKPVPGSLYAFADALDKPIVVTLNGKPVAATPDTLGYITIDRTWKSGDSITIDFPIPSETNRAFICPSVVTGAAAR